MRKLGISINTANIIIKAIEIYPSFKEKKYKTLLSWCYRFLKRNNYSIRRTTHLGQELKANAKEEFVKFLNIIYSIRRTYNINESYEYIINIDETPIWFEMSSNTTIEKIGNKSVTIKTFGSERTRLSLLLAINANGGKLKPLIVFRGKFNSTKQNRLNKNLHVAKKELYVVCQENSWVTKEIFEFWLTNILFPYGRFINKNSYKLLIMDRASTHYLTNLTSLLEKEKWKYCLIPPGLTRFAQPLDISINFPMKQYLINYDSLFRINTLNKIKPTEEDIINKIYEIWNDGSKITKEMIFNSFKKPGISVKLDNSEKNLINVSDELIDLNDIPDPDNLINQEDLINENQRELENLNNKKDTQFKAQSSLLDYYMPSEDMDLC